MSSQDTVTALSADEARRRLQCYYLTAIREEVDMLPDAVKQSIACRVQGYAAAMASFGNPSDDTLDEIMEELGQETAITQ